MVSIASSRGNTPTAPLRKLGSSRLDICGCASTCPASSNSTTKPDLPTVLAQRFFGLAKQDVAGHHAVATGPERHSQRVAGRSRPKNRVRIGQRTGVRFVGPLVPRPFARIVVVGAGLLGQSDEGIGQERGRGRRRTPELRNPHEPEFRQVGRLETHPRRGSGPIDVVHLDEAAVVISHIEIEQRFIVPQHRHRQHVQPWIVQDARALHRRQAAQDLQTVPHRIELGLDAVGGKLGDLIEEGAGRRPRDRLDPPEAEEHQRQAHGKHDPDEQRDDRCPKSQPQGRRSDRVVHEGCIVTP